MGKGGRSPNRTGPAAASPAAGWGFYAPRRTANRQKAANDNRLSHRARRRKWLALGLGALAAALLALLGTRESWRP